MDTGKAFLQKPNDNGVSVYSHLTDVLATLLEKKPANALAELEGVSASVKQQHFSVAGTVVPDAPALTPPSESSVGWAKAASTLLAAPAGETDEGLQFPNLLEERSFFRAAGIGLTEEETYSVYASLIALQQAKGLSTIRFFGKVLGTGADYFVAEATYTNPPEPEEGAPEPAADVEPMGQGCNTYTYFVTNSPAAEWTELPNVTPQQMLASSTIRKFFTGDLSAEVRAYPPFPGKENAYLRAQIARIVHATTLTPAGKFSNPEEPDFPGAVVATDPDEYKPLPAEALAKPSGWCTYYMGVLGTTGRCSHPPVEDQEDEDGNPLPKPVLEAETPALSPLADAEWATGLHTEGGPTVAVARSIVWPGAACAALQSEDKFANLYIGYGHPVLGAPFTVVPPPPMCTEPEALVEQEEPPLEEENVPVIAAAEKELAEAAEAEAAANEE